MLIRDMRKDPGIIDRAAELYSFRIERTRIFFLPEADQIRANKA